MSKNIYTTALLQRAFHKDYMKHRKIKSAINREIFFELSNKFNREVMKLILYKGIDFRMPYKLGMLRVIKLKTRGLVYDDNGNLLRKDYVKDFSSTMKLWERDPQAKIDRKYIYFLNEHTDGFVYKFSWNKYTVNIQNIRSYKFKPTRSNKLWLYEVITDDDLDVDYFELKKRKDV